MMATSEILCCLKGARINGFVEFTCVLFINPRPEDPDEVIHITRGCSPVQLIVKPSSELAFQNSEVRFVQEFNVVPPDNVR